MDFGLYLFHNAHRLVGRGTAPYLYLPKLQHHLEARLWNDVFVTTQETLGVPQGTIRATVLIETLPAAFQMEEMLYELRDHSYGLNAGRWDYIFSMIKTFKDRPEFVLPDRTDVKMTVPFMRAYTDLLVATCHRRGAFAMGGMAALIPSRRDAEANERAITAVREDKAREAGAGFDGTWVAHPDVVGVALTAFDEVLGDRPNQIDRQRPDVATSPAQLLDAGRHPWLHHRGRPAGQPQRGVPVHLVLARRPGRGRHQQSDGGRRHRGDLPVAGVALDPARGATRRRSGGDPRTGAAPPRRGDRADPRRGRR